MESIASVGALETWLGTQFFFFPPPPLLSRNALDGEDHNNHKAFFYFHV